jgi:hypothetical protein
MSVSTTPFRLFVSLLLVTVLVGCEEPWGAGVPGDENDPVKTSDLKNID